MENEILKITRTFDAPKEMVFDAFGNPEALNSWWGPAECENSLVSLDYREGGMFHYKMVNGSSVNYGRILYKTIKPTDLLEVLIAFADETGKAIPPPFDMKFPLEVFYTFEFIENNGRTTINMVGTPVNASSEEVQTFAAIHSSMQEGFGKSLDQLASYLEAKFKLRREMKTASTARVCTYLNFPGNTEEVINFYKSVFRTEFIGKGIQRFEDIPATEGQPPVAEAIKKMVLHVELPTLGGHILMATDAPKEMGFELIQGNNMHISLEPESREEAKRLFDALAEGGKITMPLEDMFFGSYFGSCVDRYGINWMVNFSSVKQENGHQNWVGG